MKAFFPQLSFTIFTLYFVLNQHFIIATQDDGTDKLVEVHKAQKRKFFKFIQMDLCKHIYIDMGTNIGMQIRKLYEPHLFPKASSLPYFRSVFPEDERHSVCSIGFEPNSLHTQRLLDVQNGYQASNYPSVIFTNTAVSTYDGTITFFRAPFQNKHYHESGASTVVWDGVQQTTNETSISLDIDRFLHTVLHQWHQSSAYSNFTSRMIAKLDIEGGEYDVLPHMLAHGSLCKMDNMLIEWHSRFFPNASEYILHPEEKLFWFLPSVKRCRFHQVDLDDNDYADGSDRRPFPAVVEKNLLQV